MIQKRLTVVVILLFVGICIIPVIAQNSEKPEPTSKGSWLYVGGSGPGNYTRVQDAIDDASDGDIVFVYNGTYYENLIVNKTIDLIGEDKNTTIIDSGGTGSVVYISSDGVRISDFTLKNSGLTWPDSGIRLYYSNNTKIINNTISYCCIGIQLFFSHNNTITANRVFNNNRSIAFTFSNDNIISGDNVSNSEHGIWIDFSSRNTITSNNVHSNSKHGIIFTTSSTNNTIAGNNASNNYWGILLSYSWDNIIMGNNVLNNTYGVSIYHPSYSNNNDFYHNNFINNTQNALDECNNTWDNGYPSCGNYWSDYTGTDDDGDGVGDIPYNIPGLDNEDRYPLMEPYGMTTLSLEFQGGIFKYYTMITNTGNITAFNVSWITEIQGSFVLFGKHASGTLSKPLLSGEEARVPSRLLIGFGSIMITMAIWADNAPYTSKSIPGKLLLFFIKI